MNKTFGLIIAGGRDFNDYFLLEYLCDFYLENVKKEYNIVIISGTANGADKLGERYAEARGYELKRFPADWDTHGKSAGYKRNTQMAEYALTHDVGACIVFWNEVSKGSKHMIDICNKYKLKLRTVLY